VIVSFTIPGEPQAWKRPGKGAHGHSYTDAAMTQAKAAIVLHARRAAGAVTFPSGPVRLDVVAVYPRPEKRPGWCSAEAWATGERLFAVPATDGSNVRKLVEDALGTDRTRGWKLWHDDNQVAAGETWQVYAALGEAPRVEVRVVRVVRVEGRP
jgi:Holliday junction resolvase RusA-like endonuclease